MTIYIVAKDLLYSPIDFDEKPIDFAELARKMNR